MPRLHQDKLIGGYSETIREIQESGTAFKIDKPLVNNVYTRAVWCAYSTWSIEPHTLTAGRYCPSLL